MSEALGPLSFEKPEHPFLGRVLGFGGGKEYSEQTAQAIDQEVRRIVEERYETAKELLKKHREKLERLAEALLAKEVIEGEELKGLLALT
ncbi:MAG: cell division protein FtsH, partial [Candidatus Methylomirabilales bacterium]